MYTIGVIGGSQKRTFEQIGQKNGCRVLFHDGKEGAGRRKSFKTIVKKSDCVVILLGAIGHTPMELVKQLAKKWDTELVFVNGFGATGAIEKGVAHIEHLEAAA